jgi:hypothetical protein
MPALRAVLDTNVLPSGMAYPASISGRLITAWTHGALQVVLSEYILTVHAGASWGEHSPCRTRTRVDREIQDPSMVPPYAVRPSRRRPDVADWRHNQRRRRAFVRGVPLPRRVTPIGATHPWFRRLSDGFQSQHKHKCDVRLGPMACIVACHTPFGVSRSETWPPLTSPIPI